MNEPNAPEPSLKGSKIISTNAVEGGNSSPSGTTSASSETEPIKELSPEEQMALYEKDLKENDWGHQPC